MCAAIVGCIEEDIPIDNPIVDEGNDGTAVVPHDEIWYTTYWDKVVELNDASGFDAEVVSNTWSEGKGVIKFDKDITKVGSEAFLGCYMITGIMLPNSVTIIDDYAFRDCTALSDFVFSTSLSEIGNEAFYNTGLDEVIIPDSVTNMGGEAFGVCNSLKCVTLPKNWSSTFGNVFYCCRNLSEVIIPEGTTTIVAGTFYGCSSLVEIDIPSTVTTIEPDAFYATGLTSVTIPDSIVVLNVNPFGSCWELREFKGKYASSDGRCLIDEKGILLAVAQAGLTEFIIPDGVISIGNGAFSGCGQLKNITIPNSVTTIGGGAFYACRFQNIVIPNSVISIKEGAFLRCESLVSINIPDSVIEIGSTAFRNCSNLSEVNLGNGLQTIGYAAFSECIFTSITIPDSVESIGANAFIECYNLRSFYGKFATESHEALIVDNTLHTFAPAADIDNYVIPDHICKIGDNAFYGCEKLKTITIPSGLTEIYPAFMNCKNLQAIYCRPTTPPWVDYELNLIWYDRKNNNPDAIDINCTIYVPMQSVDKYKSAPGWGKYADRIVGYDFEANLDKFEWRYIGEGAYYEDFFCYFLDLVASGLGITELMQGSSINVKYEQFKSDPNRIRVVDPFKVDSLKRLLSDDDYEYIIPTVLVDKPASTAYIEFDISDPNNVVLKGEVVQDAKGNTVIIVPLALSHADMYDICMVYVPAENGGDTIKFENGEITFPADGSIAVGGLQNGVYVGNFCKANLSGEMKFVLPGYQQGRNS